MKKAITSALITFIVVMAAVLISYNARALGPESNVKDTPKYAAVQYADSRLQEVQPADQSAYQQPGPGFGPGSGYCRSSGGGCCGRGAGAQGSASDPAVIEGIKKAASEYYSGKYNDKDFTVEVKDFGCHQEVYIIKGGEQIKRLSINNGNVNEI